MTKEREIKPLDVTSPFRTKFERDGERVYLSISACDNTGCHACKMKFLTLPGEDEATLRREVAAKLRVTADELEKEAPHG